MCTSMTLKTDDFYFGRNMDIEYGFGESVVITPRNYSIKFRKTMAMKSHYAIIGMASVVEDYPLYADAVNEKGLCVSALSFPENAYYSKQIDDSRKNIAPFEFILWILGQCSDISQVKELLLMTDIVEIPFSSKLSLTPLHWHIADKNSSITVEHMKNGIRVYDNPVGILTNNPPFDFHMMNLTQYMSLTAETPKSCFADKLDLIPFSNGFGGIGLPGDFSSASRFVKTAFLKYNSVCENDEKSSISQFFHILDASALPKGSVLTSKNRYDVTSYSCCMNSDRGVYYYKTYFNNQITAVDMYRENLDSKSLIKYPLVNLQQINMMN